MTAEQARVALRDHVGVKSHRPENFDVAMRNPGSAEATSQGGPLLWVKIIIPVLVAAAVGMAVLSWWHGYTNKAQRRL